MHIPDGFLDVKTTAVTAALSVTGVGLALNRVRRELPPHRVPLLGLSAAFVFAAQMLNFPIVGGTSGHIMGGALVAALLGPAPAVVVMTTVLIVQCFLFADGGVLALGANVFNMALLATAGGYLAFALIARALPGRRGRVTAIAFAGWFSVVLASIGCAGELAWSGTVTWPAAFTAMAGVHMLIGVGEGLISALILVAVDRTRPDLSSRSDGFGQEVRPHPEPAVGVQCSESVFSERIPIPNTDSLSSVQGSTARALVSGTTGRARIDWHWVAFSLLVILGFVLFVAPFACPWPDGLESVATKLGIEPDSMQSHVPAPAPDYAMPGIEWPVGATALAGGFGALIVFALAWWLGRILVPRQPAQPSTASLSS